MKLKYILIIIVLGLIGYFILPVVFFFGYMEWQMKAGRRCMDSITEKNIPVWIERTKGFLKEYETVGAYGTDEKPVPHEMKKLKITAIDIFPDHVNYFWVGGMDHTYLQVQKIDDANFKFTANYNDESSKVIWPKEDANQPQNTAGKPPGQ